jgi:hypothetical protein
MIYKMEYTTPDNYINNFEFLPQEQVIDIALYLDVVDIK